jgi:hypothetical protein
MKPHASARAPMKLLEGEALCRVLCASPIGTAESLKEGGRSYGPNERRSSCASLPSTRALPLRRALRRLGALLAALGGLSHRRPATRFLAGFLNLLVVPTTSGIVVTHIIPRTPSATTSGAPGWAPVASSGIHPWVLSWEG